MTLFFVNPKQPKLLLRILNGPVPYSQAVIHHVVEEVWSVYSQVVQKDAMRLCP